MTNPEILESELARLRTFLKKHDMKATVQRLAVHEAMTALTHASADMVKDWLAENSDVDITSPSIYNVLSELADLGFYHRRMSKDSKMYFDAVTSPHIHLYDRVNHEFIDIIDDKLSSMVAARLGSKRFKGYKIDEIDIQIAVIPSKKRKNRQSD